MILLLLSAAIDGIDDIEEKLPVTQPASLVPRVKQAYLRLFFPTDIALLYASCKKVWQI
jgi:hypothetical protein